MVFNKAIVSTRYSHKLFSLTILIFSVLAFAAHQLPYFTVDLEVTHWLQSYTSPWVSFLMRSVSFLGDFPVFILVIALVASILYSSGFKFEAITSSMATATSVLVGSFLKAVINRPRPEVSLISASNPLPDKSFPSLHVLVFTVFFGYLLTVLLRKPHRTFSQNLIICLLGGLIVLISFSRIYLGVHWFSDTIGGYLLGLIFLYIIHYLQKNKP